MFHKYCLLIQITHLLVEKNPLISITLHGRPYPPLVLLLENDSSTVTLRNHLSNLVIDRPMKSSANVFPLITVNVMIDRKILFFREFVNGLISQNYPKNRMTLIICHTNHKIMKEVLSSFESSRDHYHDFVVECNHDTNNSSEFTLVLHSTIVLRNNHTIINLVSQNKLFIGPMIQTNHITPKVMQTCKVYQPQSEIFNSRISFPPRQEFRNPSKPIKVSKI